MAHIFHPTALNPTHRLKSNHAIIGSLRFVPPGAKSTRPEVDPGDYERIVFPDAPAWKVKVWITRNNIDLDTIPAIIENSIPAGPERNEALIRWKEVPTVPFNHPLVDLVASGLNLDPAVAWDQILAI